MYLCSILGSRTSSIYAHFCCIVLLPGWSLTRFGSVRDTNNSSSFGSSLFTFGAWAAPNKACNRHQHVCRVRQSATSPGLSMRHILGLQVSSVHSLRLLMITARQGCDVMVHAVIHVPE